MSITPPLLRDIERLIFFCSSMATVESCVTAIQSLIRSHFNVPSAVYLLDRATCTLMPAGPTDAQFPRRMDTTDIHPTFRQFSVDRRETRIGALLIGETGSSAVSPDLMHTANMIVGLLGFLYNRRFTTLLANSHSPIDFLQSTSEFFDEIKLMTEISSGMFAGALRELPADGFELTTLFSWNGGLAEESPLGRWDIADYRTVPAIAAAIADRKPYATHGGEPGHGEFFSRTEQRNIASAVFCPVLVGLDVFGVLSFGLPIPYEYSELELDGLMGLANAVGIAIQNFRRAAAEAVSVGTSFELSTVLTAVEVAQAARHIAKTAIDTANLKIADMALTVKGHVPGEVRNELLSDLNELSTYSLRIAKSLDDIKAAAKPPKQTVVDYSLSAILEEASRQMRGRLNRENIQVGWDGADISVRCYSDHLRHLLLNLLINSIDAFTERRTTGKRTIRCKLSSVIGNRVSFRYIDNAGGLDIVKLRSLTSVNIDPAQFIFERDVTTKGDIGSGWGLFLCRRIADRHKGSINVIDYRRGMTFEIELGLGTSSSNETRQ